MRRVYLATVLLALTAACGQQPATEDAGTAVAAGASVEAEPAPTTTVTTAPPTTMPAPATTAAPPTTARRPGPPLPSTTPTTAPRPTTTSTTIHPPAATVKAHGATMTLKATPRPEIPGFRFTVELTTADLQYVESVKYDFGDGPTYGFIPDDPGPICSRQPRVVSDYIHHTWPAAGTYRARAIVTVIPCLPAVGPPGSPPGVPNPDMPRQIIEVSMVVTQQLPMEGARP